MNPADTIAALTAALTQIQKTAAEALRLGDEDDAVYNALEDAEEIASAALIANATPKGQLPEGYPFHQ